MCPWLVLILLFFLAVGATAAAAEDVGTDPCGCGLRGGAVAHASLAKADKEELPGRSPPEYPSPYFSALPALPEEPGDVVVYTAGAVIPDKILKIGRRVRMRQKKTVARRLDAPPEGVPEGVPEGAAEGDRPVVPEEADVSEILGAANQAPVDDDSAADAAGDESAADSAVHAAEGDSAVDAAGDDFGADVAEDDFAAATSAAGPEEAAAAAIKADADARMREEAGDEAAGAAAEKAADLKMPEKVKEKSEEQQAKEAEEEHQAELEAAAVAVDEANAAENSNEAAENEIMIEEHPREYVDCGNENQKFVVPYNEELNSDEVDDGSPRERWVYFITPTVDTTVRLSDMTRLSHILGAVKRLLWIVIEDAKDGNPEVMDLLERKRKQFGLQSVYLTCKKDPTEMTRGNTQRNCGLQWLLDRVWPENKASLKDIHKLTDFNETFTGPDGWHTWHRCSVPYKVVGDVDPPGWEIPKNKPKDKFRRPGIVYYGDDDNSYDSELLIEMRDQGRYISLWPVGAMIGVGIAAPIIDKEKKQILGIYDGWVSARAWPVDMAMFGLDLEYMYEKDPRRAYWYTPCPEQVSMAENDILSMFGRPDQNKYTVLGEQGTKVYAWHVKSTRRARPPFVPSELLTPNLNFANLAFYKSMVNLNHPDSHLARQHIVWV